MGFERITAAPPSGGESQGLAPEAERQLGAPGQRIVEEVWPEDERFEVRAIAGGRLRAHLS